MEKSDCRSPAKGTRLESFAAGWTDSMVIEILGNPCNLPSQDITIGQDVAQSLRQRGRIADAALLLSRLPKQDRHLEGAPKHRDGGVWCSATRGGAWFLWFLSIYESRETSITWCHSLVSPWQAPSTSLRPLGRTHLAEKHVRR